MKTHVSVLQPAFLLDNESSVDTETIGRFFYNFNPLLASMRKRKDRDMQSDMIPPETSGKNCGTAYTPLQ